MGGNGYSNTNNIGDNETPASAGDVHIGGLVAHISVGYLHACALLDTGAVRCWGEGTFGKLGYGNVNNLGDDETPASVGDVKLGGRAVQISAGGNHTCALLDSGAVRCWGANWYGQLGYGHHNNIGDDEAPSSAGDVDVGGPAVQISAGMETTCALLATGSVRCWGFGVLGQLGYANLQSIGDDETPAAAGDVPIGGRVLHIDVGFGHTCALLDTGNVRCWGRGSNGVLGYGNIKTIGDDETPASAGDVVVGGPVAEVSAGNYLTCARLTNGSVRCWGADGIGYQNKQLIGDNETPASVGDVNVGASVAKIDVGYDNVCAVLTNGKVRCWGRSALAGELGYGNKNAIGDDEFPASAGDVPLWTD